MAGQVCRVLLYASALTACLGAQFSSQGLTDDAVLYVCENDDVLLPWNVSLTTGETIQDIRWFCRGTSDELIAISSQGQLNVMPAFSGRVEQTTNGGLLVSHVTEGEKGNYSVEVNVLDAKGEVTTLRRTVSVHVERGLMTTDGQLHASQMAVAVFSNSTQQWHVALACGTFTYHDTPPFDMEWITPSEQVVSSSQYKEGQFLLLLDNPVSGGSYTCRLPHSAISPVCLQGKNSNSAQRTVEVDQMESRLAVVEAKQNALMDENAKLKARLMQQEVEHKQQMLISIQNGSSDVGLHNVSDRLTQDSQWLKTELKQQGEQLRNLTDALSKENQKLTEQLKQQQEDMSNLTNTLVRENQRLTDQTTQQHGLSNNATDPLFQQAENLTNQLKYQNERMTNLSSELLNENQILTGQLKEQSEKLNNLTDELSTKTQHMTLQFNQQHQQTVYTLNQQINNVTNHLMLENQQTTDRLNQQINNVTDTLTEQNEHIQRLNTQLTLGEEETNKIKHQLQQQTDWLNSLAMQLHSQTEQLNNITNLTTDDHQGTHTLTTPATGEPQQPVNLTTHVDLKCDQRNCNLTGEMLHVNERLDNLTKQMTQKCQHVENLTLVLERERHRIDNLTRQVTQGVDSRTDQLASTCQRSVDNLTNQLTKQNERVDNLTAQMVQQQMLVNDLTQRSTEANQQTHNLTYKLEEEHKAVHNLTNQLITKCQLLDVFTDQVAQQNQQVSNLTSQLVLEGQRIDNLTNQMKPEWPCLNDKLDNHTITIQQNLTNQIQREHQQLHNLTNQMEQYFRMVENLTTQATSDHADLDYLRGHVAMQYERVRNLTDRVNKMQDSENTSSTTFASRQNEGFQRAYEQLTNESQRLNSLEKSMDGLLQGGSTAQVSFNARGLRDYNPTSGSALVLPAVYGNHGNGYDPLTGYFIAPNSGTYLFLATMGTGGLGNSLSVYLMVDQSSVDYVNTHTDDVGHTETASLQTVTYVRAGAKVWLKSTGRSAFSTSYTTFSGVLLHAGP